MTLRGRTKMKLAAITTAVLAFIAAYIVFYIHNIDTTVPEEFFYKTGDFIRKYGFDYEEHTVETEDGFLTTIFRIVTNKQNKPVPVLVEGGIFCSSDLFVLSGPDKDLAFLLASAGFDVWLGNYRGNRYSRPGPRANLSDKHILNYGYHEMGIYDFSASIDHVVARTGAPQVDAIGVSAGCGGLLALLSTRPEYNDRVRKVLQLGCGLALQTVDFNHLFFFYGMWTFPDLIRESKLFEPYPARPAVMLNLCKRTFLRFICSSLLESIGFPIPYNSTLGALIGTLLPSGNPLGVLDHMMQLTISDEQVFRMRDWGPEENIRRYNSSKPPVYDTSRVTAYTRSYSAEDDNLVTHQVPKAAFGLVPNYAGDMQVRVPFKHSNFFINSAKSSAFVADLINTLST